MLFLKFYSYLNYFYTFENSIFIYPILHEGILILKAKVFRKFDCTIKREKHSLCYKKLYIHYLSKSDYFLKAYIDIKILLTVKIQKFKLE